MPRHLLAVHAALAVAALVACSDSDDSGPRGGFVAENRPLCAIDIDTYRGEKSSARATARRITSENDLLRGEAAQGRVGDLLLANERLRAIVQGADRAIAVNPWGGNLIDIAPVQGGEPGPDVLGEIAPFYNLGRTTDPGTDANVFVLHDGSDGRAAVVAVNGSDTVNDYVAVADMLRSAMGGAQLALDSETPVPAEITSYFFLEPDAARLRVVTAFCNRTSAPFVVGVGDLVDAGGNLEMFNPHLREGWGQSSLPRDAPFLAWVGEAGGYALVPGDGSLRNQSLSTSGVTGTLQGSNSLFEYAGPLRPDAPPSGALTVPPGGSARYDRHVVPGADLASITAEIFRLRGDESGTVHGTVTAGGAPVAGARVAAVRSRDGGTFTETVFVADAEGRFSGTLPGGAYELFAGLPGQISAPVAVEISAGAQADAALTLAQTGTLTVQVRDAASGNPLAARVHVLCAGPCATPRSAEGRFRDVDADPLPEGVFAIRHVGPSGDISFDLPAGPWEVLVSRGAEYDTFPADFPDTGHGHAVAVAAGGAEQVTATVARVVDTTGWLSADFHVHAINSPDSPVPNRERVISLVAENVEVAVQTDHDFVTDLAPEVEAVGARGLIRTVVGTEMTTFDFGHANAFPLTVDASQRNGGAIDWGGGTGATLTPGAMFQAARDRGAAVVQVNHARSSGSMGGFDMLQLDTATLATHADPVRFRMAPNGNDPAVDSGLFSRDFTALEILNGFGESTFKALLNDWITFLGQGLVVTGTAVSDTHKLASTGPGSPRSWVFVGADSLADLDIEAFAAAVKGGRVVGGTAPFVTFTATRGEDAVGPGETLAPAPGEVALTVSVQAPRWAPFNRVEVYAYRPGTEATGGRRNGALPLDAVALQSDGSPARLEVDLADPAFTAPGFEGGAGHTVYRVEHTFRFQPAADTFYFVLVRAVASAPDGLDPGEAVPRTLDPIAYGEGGDARALAFTNPVYVDVDGGGYDKFPLATAAAQGLVRTSGPPPARLPVPADEAAFHRNLEALSHQH